MKILIISHNPISNQSNMGKTFLSLFHQFSGEELCQLYIYPVIPNEKRCSSYYRITDKDALKAVIRLRKPGGEIAPERITESQGLYEDAQDQSFYKNRKNKSPLRRLLRDAMWRMTPWYNRDLKAWLDREKPECVFVAPGVAKFLYDFALRISADRKIPVVTYICDEYYFVKEPAGGMEKLRLKLLRKKMEQLLARTRHLVTISQEMREEYKTHFGVPATMIMTGAMAGRVVGEEAGENPRNLCYFGNVRCNRYITLAQIGRVLDEMNREYGEDYCLKIYSAEKDPEILDVFREIQSIQLCGFVSGAEFDRAFREADLLVHTEAFDEASMDFTRHSISTKIADSLASGIPMVAYGPAEISSMAHLLRHRCALTAISPDGLRDMLETALRDKNARTEAARRAMEAAAAYHDLDRNAMCLRSVIEAAVKEND